MDLIEWLLAGIGVRKVQRPLVFLTMGIATLFFGGLAIVIVVVTIKDIGQSDNSFIHVISGGGIAILFGGLAAISGYMVRRCFELDR